MAHESPICAGQQGQSLRTLAGSGQTRVIMFDPIGDSAIMPCLEESRMREDVVPTPYRQPARSAQNSVALQPAIGRSVLVAGGLPAFPDLRVRNVGGQVPRSMGPYAIAAPHTISLASRMTRSPGVCATCLRLRGWGRSRFLLFMISCCFLACPPTMLIRWARPRRPPEPSGPRENSTDVKTLRGRGKSKYLF